MANVADGNPRLQPQIQAALEALVERAQGFDDSEKVAILDHLEQVAWYRQVWFQSPKVQA